MDLIVESAGLLKIASRINLDLFGSTILQSLRDQKRQNIFCDVLIQCGNELVPAHGSILFAISEYCRTLFTGSLPPPQRDGKLLLELSLFSSGTIKVFIDLIYGMKTSDVEMVDVGELLKLADYLQVSDKIFTKILRNYIDTENCVKLYELTLSYNCNSLSSIIESYICDSLRKLVKTSFKDLSETALSTLQKNPLYLSQPIELIGAEAKECLKHIDVDYMLMTYDRDSLPSYKNSLLSVETESEMSVYTEETNRTGRIRRIKYFIFQYELYAMTWSFKDFILNIGKYNQNECCFVSVLSFCHPGCGPVDQSQLPSYISNGQFDTIITSISNEHIFIMFYPFKTEIFYMMKLKMGNSINPTMELEESFSGILRTLSAICCKRSIYFFDSSVYYTYNFDTRAFERHALEDFRGADQYQFCKYCEFQDKIYVFALLADSDVRIFCLNEQDLCWELLSEHDISPRRYFHNVEVVSSPNDLFLIMDVDMSEDEDSDDFADDEDSDDFRNSIYRYDPASRNLLIWKEYDSLSFDRRHIFVPEYLFL